MTISVSGSTITFSDGSSMTSGLPSQSGNSGLYLTTNGSTATWSAFAGALATPTLSAVTSANMGSVISVTITNYNAAYSYNISITGGSYSVTGGTITWTLPVVASNTAHYINVQAIYSGSSSVNGTATVNVLYTLVSDSSVSITDFNSNTLSYGWVI